MVKIVTTYVPPCLSPESSWEQESVSFCVPPPVRQFCFVQESAWELEVFGKAMLEAADANCGYIAVEIPEHYRLRFWWWLKLT